MVVVVVVGARASKTEQSKAALDETMAKKSRLPIYLILRPSRNFGLFEL